VKRRADFAQRPDAHKTREVELTILTGNLEIFSAAVAYDSTT
jgi:hypothetical protein